MLSVYMATVHSMGTCRIPLLCEADGFAAVSWGKCSGDFFMNKQEVMIFYVSPSSSVCGSRCCSALTGVVCSG